MARVVGVSPNSLPMLIEFALVSWSWFIYWLIYKHISHCVYYIITCYIIKSLE